MFYLSIYLFENISQSIDCFLCLFYDPTLVKLVGHFAFGLSVCVHMCVGLGVFRLECMPVGLCAEMWLAGSVGHFFEALNGDC